MDLLRSLGLSGLLPPSSSAQKSQPSPARAFRLALRSARGVRGRFVKSFRSGQDVLVNDNDGYTSGGGESFTQSETSIVAYGNYVIIGFNDSGSFAVEEPAGNSIHFTGYSRSVDGGRTFVDGGVLPASAGGDVGDPVLGRDAKTNRIYFSTLRSEGPGIQVFRSDNNGATWMAPVQGAPGRPAGSFQDKQWLDVDNFSGPGNGNVYIAAREFTSAAPGIYLYRSTDGGATFGPDGGVKIVAENQGAYVVVAPDHSVSVFYYDRSAGKSIQVRKSVDYGVSFADPVAVAALSPDSGSNGNLGLTGRRQGESDFAGFRSNSFPHAAVNPRNGDLYVVYNDIPAGADKGDVFLVISSDGGATWSTPVRVNDDATTTDQWQPTIAISPLGDQIGVFYYSRQEDAAENNLFKYYGRLATLGSGQPQFGDSFAVSDVASLPEFGRDANVNPSYQGDYNQVAVSSSQNGFAVTWSDNRDDLPGGGQRKDPNVYFELVDFQALPVALSLDLDGAKSGDDAGKYGETSPSWRSSGGRSKVRSGGAGYRSSGRSQSFASDRSGYADGDGLVPVAILGDVGFDVRGIRLASLRASSSKNELLAGGGEELELDKDDDRYVLGDVNGDSFLDLMVYVDRDDLLDSGSPDVYVYGSSRFLSAGFIATQPLSVG